MSYQYRCLLAKKSKTPDSPDRRETLAGHILDVVVVTNTMVASWGDVFLSSMGLPQNWNNDLLSASLRGAFLHDLGKANNQFQRLVRQGPEPPQALRHEWISLHILLRFQTLDRWLFPQGENLVWKAAVFAAVGHHLQIPDGSAISPRDGSGDSKVLVMTGHPDVTDLFGHAGDYFRSSDSKPLFTDLTIDLLSDNPLAEPCRWLEEANRWWQSASAEERRFIALVKALVIAADLAGSAMPRLGVDAAVWAKRVLARTCRSEEVERLAIRGLEGKLVRQFQTDVARTQSRVTLLRAGCGSGKTTAAYLWSAQNAGKRKLFFCYPTTGTATEGYRDYVLGDDIDGALIHSRAEVDLEDLIETPEDIQDRQVRTEALAAWDVPLVVCTADTVLGLVQNNRRGLFSFPAIANGSFVFDEIHAYDDRLFGSLLRFIEAFSGVPVLLMTASLPETKLKALTELAARLGESLVQIQGALDLEAIPRYRLERMTTENVWGRVEQMLASGGKVLWVTNTVERAIAFGKEAVKRGLRPVLPYHSRYRYCDRVEKHRAVIEAFKKRGPALAVTTQVCEISLNISADLLVTDLAPIASLIQRLGRLNRYVTTEAPGQPRMALFLTPEISLPYEEAEISNAQTWLDRLAAGPVSQTDLAQRFLQVLGESGETQSVASAWLDGGPFSAPAPLREAGVTIPVVCGEDASAAQEDRNQVVRLAIPMLLGPVANEVTTWRRIGVARVAPVGRIDYSEEWGAKWRK